jgi:hypothetical protein
MLVDIVQGLKSLTNLVDLGSVSARDDTTARPGVPSGAASQQRG